MKLKLENKQAIVAEVREIAKAAHTVVVAEYRSLTVAAMTQLRAQARNSGVYLRVVRNTLAYRAFEGTKFACLQAYLRGPLLFAFSQQEPGSAPRLIRTFVKEHAQLVVKQLAYGGQLLTVKDLDSLADLPTYDEAIAKLMAMMQAPIAQLVRTLAEPQAKLARLLAALLHKRTRPDLDKV